jgi:transcriptional regulator with XRE-family HTH domain
MPDGLHPLPLAVEEADGIEISRALELGAFLRARRESLDPARLGMPRYGRRRTPGLRREEVAHLAEIGTTWYTRLEQGKPIRVSARVLGAVASALQCSGPETRHLFTLAGLEQPAATSHTAVCESLSAASQAILDRLDPIPALIQNARFDIVGYNRAFQRLMGIDFATLPPEDRNCLYLAVSHPGWRAALADWETALPHIVALFRAAMAEHMHEPTWESLLERCMAASAEFRELWPRYQVRGVENHVKRFRHADVGILNLQQSNWWSAPKNGDRLVIYAPADPESEQALQRLAGL